MLQLSTACIESDDDASSAEELTARPQETGEMDKTKVGLYNKFRVERVDGQSEPGQKHDGCDYFVLDLTHDPHAAPALKAYADSCRAQYPLLAADLDDKVQR